MRAAKARYSRPVPRSPQIHRGNDTHARSELAVTVLSGFKHDLDGNPLDDLDEVPGRIFRRQQTEERPGRAADAVDVPAVSPAARIDIDLGTLSRPQLLELGLREIGREPNVVER